MAYERVSSQIIRKTVNYLGIRLNIKKGINFFPHKRYQIKFQMYSRTKCEQ